MVSSAVRSLKSKQVSHNKKELNPCTSPPDDLPKPQITVHPVTTAAVLGKDVRLTCTAASSSSSPMTFTWLKDQETLRQAEVENFAHVRASDGGVMEYTTILHLRHVTFNHEGRYQCIISNHFGSSYSNKARVTVNGTFNKCKLYTGTLLHTFYTLVGYVTGSSTVGNVYVIPVTQNSHNAQIVYSSGSIL